MDLNSWLEKLVTQKGSDLFLTVGAPPIIKVHGKLVPLSENPLKETDIDAVLINLMGEEDQQKFQKHKELNIAIDRQTLGRFRVSAFQQRLQKGAVIRRIETKIPTFEELHLPPILQKFSMIKRGLILFVGGTGTGKSSSLAAMVDYRNEHHKGHIICIEDPIEYMHDHKKSIITQREIGIDTENYEIALRNSLRQAPDVILIGEIRTREVMQYALAFAETGHLCLATLHANNANQALDRIASFFSNDQHAELWMSLSLNLKAIVAQQLIPTSDGKSRIPAVEIMINSPVIANHIRKGEINVLKEFISKSNEEGMQTFDQSLFKLYEEGKITYEDALKHADSENEVRLMIKLKQGTQGRPHGQKGQNGGPSEPDLSNLKVLDDK